MGRGFLIVLEGVDGSGKTTQAQLLAAALEERGYPVVLTREPSFGPVGQRLRQYLQGNSRHLSPGEELELFMADRREHVARLLKPALTVGRVVICDRYYYSSAAYQGALGLDPVEILSQNEAFAPRPDLVLLLTLPAAEALARRQAGAGAPPQVSESLAYLEKVAAIYETLSDPCIHRLEARGAPEEIHEQILSLTLKALKGG